MYVTLLSYYGNLRPSHHEPGNILSIPSGGRLRDVVDEKKRLDDLFRSTYQDLKKLASGLVQRKAAVVLNTTALVNESYLKLAGSRGVDEWSVTHFRNVAAIAMKQVLVDEARRQLAGKRGGGEAIHVTLNDYTPMREMPLERILILNDCVEKLRAMNPRQAEALVHRYYGGLSNADIARLLGLSEITVERDLRVAKAWLATCLERAH